LLTLDATEYEPLPEDGPWMWAVVAVVAYFIPPRPFQRSKLCSACGKPPS
jgi:hypothetical protein